MEFFIKISVLFLLFLFIPHVFCQETGPRTQGSVTDALHRKITEAVSRGEIGTALRHYEDLYLLLSKEDRVSLEPICLKAIEQAFASEDSRMKMDFLTFIASAMNAPLARMLCKTLYDPQDEIRKQAVKLLSKWGKEDIFPEMAACLQSGNLYAMMAALNVIYHTRQKTFVEPVMKLLSHEDIFIKAKAIETLAQLQPDEELAKKLTPFLSHSSEYIRSAVVEAFCFINSDAASVQPVLKDGSERVRLSLLHWAELNPGETADRIIRKELQLKEPSLFPKACSAAMKSEKMMGQVDWAFIAENDSDSLRYLALKAVVKSGEVFNNEDLIIRFLNDFSDEIRSFMAEKLISSQDMAAKVTVKKILETGTTRAKLAVIHQLGKQEKCDLPEQMLIHLLNDPHSFIQKASALLVRHIHSQSQQELIRSLLSSNKINVRAAAYSFLKELKSKELYRLFFKQGLNDPAVSVQQSVLEGLGMLEDAEKRPVLKAKMTSLFSLLRIECIRQSAGFASVEEQWEWINKGAKDPFSGVRKASLETALGMKDKIRVAELFSDMLFDPDQSVRLYALSELKSPAVSEKEEKKDKIKESEETKKEDEKSSELKEKTTSPVSQKEKLDVSVPKQNDNKLMSWLKAGKQKKDKKQTLSLKPSDTPVPSVLNQDRSASASKNVEKKLKQLLASGKTETADEAEDLLLQMGNEKALENVQNTLLKGTAKEREKAVRKLGLLRKSSVIPVLREQLKFETDKRVKFEIAFTILNLISG
ncbi:MAG: HEAT repeat domain-containing protein [Candidatus Aureabacteria bacterium]|nr:HEAT repeat domain-containing protein [Candidatus Auribacterota bacterium]